MKPQIAFIGVGAMGAGMVANLCRKGFAVTFLGRDTPGGRAAADRLAGEGARREPDLQALAAEADVVILCLPDSRTVEGVLDASAGFVPGLKNGALIVDCSTSHPESTRRLAADLAKRGITLLDGPLTGSRTQADAGTLNVLGAGPREAFDRVRSVLNAFATHVFHLGDTGAGHAAKLINNFFGQLALAGLCEVWPLLGRHGIDLDAFRAAISVSGGNSATFQGVFPRLCAGDFSLNFAQRLAAKDIRYLADLLRNAGSDGRIAGRMGEIYEQAAHAGFGDRDVTEMLRFYASKSP